MTAVVPIAGKEAPSAVPVSPTCAFPDCPEPPAPRTKATGRPPDYCVDPGHTPKAAHLEKARRAALAASPALDPIALLDTLQAGLAELTEVVAHRPADADVTEATGRALHAEETAAAAALEATQERLRRHEAERERDDATARGEEAVAASANLHADHQATVEALAASRDALAVLEARARDLGVEVEAAQERLGAVAKQMEAVAERSTVARKEMSRLQEAFEEDSGVAQEEITRLRADGGTLRSRLADLTLAVAEARVTAAQGHEDLVTTRSALGHATERIDGLTSHEVLLQARVEELTKAVHDAARRADVAEGAAASERERRMDSDARLAAADSRYGDLVGLLTSHRVAETAPSTDTSLGVG